MRAVPDVALSAADHDGYFAIENGSYWIFSGTSAASPSFAGVMALVLERMGGEKQGNANAELYPLVNAARNPFHSTATGNNSVPGVTGFTADGADYNLATGLGSIDGELLIEGWGVDAEIDPIIARPIGCSPFSLLTIRCEPPRRAPTRRRGVEER
jgi:pseudomonalisin